MTTQDESECWRRPTVDELREWLIAKPRAGKLLWRKTAHMSGRKGGEIRTYRAGASAMFQDAFDRTSVIIPGRTRVLASHAMWALVHGEFPKRLIHKDGGKRNIAIHNLTLDNQAARDKRTISKSNVKGSYKSARKALRGTPIGECVSGQPEAVLEEARRKLEKDLPPKRRLIARSGPAALVARALAEGEEEDARVAVEDAAWGMARQVDTLGRALRRTGRRA